jgi:hypothetical protein
LSYIYIDCEQKTKSSSITIQFQGWLMNPQAAEESALNSGGPYCIVTLPEGCEEGLPVGCTDGSPVG